MGIQITNDPILILVTLYCHVYFGERRDWWRGLHCGNVPVKNNSSLLLFWKGNLLFHIFLFMWWNWWYPFFLFISETTCPVPSKVRRRGHATPSGLYVRHFVFFGRSDLPPQHDWLCHRQPNNNKPQKNLPRITCHILFCLTFMQLFIYNYKEFPNTHYSWLLSCLKTVPWGCWPLSVLPKAATRITLAA